MNKYTNKDNLSLPIAVWSLMDNYNHDSRENLISATSLLKPLRQIYLGRKYKDNIKEIDASDLLNASMGTALHDSVESSWKNKEKVIGILTSLGYMHPEDIYNDVILERRTEKEINGYIISGQFDIAFKGTVCDIKSTSVWSYIYGSKDEDYILQMSIYKWLNQDIITNDFGYIEYIFTDWSSVKAMQDKSYPQCRNISKKLQLYSIEKIEQWISDKLDELSKLEKLNNDSLIPECSDEELWREADTYKVYMPNKTTGKISYGRATKNFTDKDEAYRFAGSSGEVKEFKGGVKRCNYCNYTNLCSQYTSLLMRGDIKK